MIIEELPIIVNIQNEWYHDAVQMYSFFDIVDNISESEIDDLELEE